MSRNRLKCPLLVVECFELTSSLARPVIFFQCGISDFTAHIDGNGALLTESYQHWLISGARAMGKILCREHWDVRGAVHGPPFLFCLKQNRDSSEESSEYGGGRQSYRVSARGFRDHTYYYSLCSKRENILPQ